MALLFHHRTKHNTFTLTVTNPSLLRRLFSVNGGDGGGGDDQPPSNSKSPFSSYFRDVKDSLKQKKPSSLPSSPSVEEIQRNLSEFRRRTSAPPPPTDTPSFSFQDLYNNRNASQKPDEPAGDPDLRTAKKSGGGKYSFDAIRASLNQISNSPRGGGGGDGGMSLPAFRDILKTTPSDSASPSKPVFGGTNPLPESVFGRELREKMNREGSPGTGINMEFLRGYDHEKLGEKLKKLRPEGKAQEWFSIRELNERLMKLREMEANEPQKGSIGLSFTDLREGLRRVQDAEDDKAKKSSLQRIEILSQLGGTPNYLLAPPKELLVETYFHPDNMSSAEKLKIELEKVRDEFKMSESDCGSARVQVAQLTTKIKHLSSVLHKKDVHSRKGLLAMVQRRKRLLKYLRRTDWDSYCFVISKLGLRDNPEHTYRSRTGQAVHA